MTVSWSPQAPLPDVRFSKSKSKAAQDDEANCPYTSVDWRQWIRAGFVGASVGKGRAVPQRADANRPLLNAADLTSRGDSVYHPVSPDNHRPSLSPSGTRNANGTFESGTAWSFVVPGDGGRPARRFRGVLESLAANGKRDTLGGTGV